MARDYTKIALDLVSNPKWSFYLCLVFLVVEIVFNSLIIRMVDYTEIDWVAYMEQVKQYTNGERDYTKISGSTGPLVYPALHVFIYQILFFMTNGGQDILVAQIAFLLLYVINLSLVFLCYRQAKVPPWVFPMLVLSKRMHSIYVLRCFNDGFAMFFFFLAIYLFQKRQWPLGAIAFSLGLGVKMSLLLALPAVAVILHQAIGPTGAIGQAARMVFIQVAIASPFLRENWRGYLSRSFDFSRVFLYKWTVNWKFVSEETFLSREFSIALLVAHASLLTLFLATRWLKPSGKTLPQFLTSLLMDPKKEEQKAQEKRVTPEFIMTTMLTANAIGMLCARSLHYQFFAWIGWATPYLLWRAKLNPALAMVLWLGQELAWLQYPANELSSKIVVGVLAAMVFQVWLGTDEPVTPLPAEQQRKEALKRIMESRKDLSTPARGTRSHDKH